MVPVRLPVGKDGSILLNDFSSLNTRTTAMVPEVGHFTLIHTLGPAIAQAALLSVDAAASRAPVWVAIAHR